ncbi:hypothetical protein [Tannerella forsythia]|uniref:hypothetical protein n=1 Tax=Tannerella forsythia TaxID=28112 RepID=UPI0028E20A81|nr:hypothetical protein [Tannerella forsythia]
MATNEKKKKAAEQPETAQDAAQVNPETVEQQDTEATAETSAEATQEEPAQADTATVPEAETTQETAPEEAPEELQEVARSLMREHGVSVVYHCPVNGYWFINEQYVSEYIRESGNMVDVYKNEVNVEGHDA